MVIRSSNFDGLKTPRSLFAREVEGDSSDIHPTASTTLPAHNVQPSVPAALEQIIVTHKTSKQAMSIGQILDSSSIGRKRLTSIETEDLELASPIADFILG